MNIADILLSFVLFWINQSWIFLCQKMFVLLNSLNARKALNELEFMYICISTYTIHVILRILNTEDKTVCMRCLSFQKSFTDITYGRCWRYHDSFINTVISELEFYNPNNISWCAVTISSYICIIRVYRKL